MLIREQIIEPSLTASVSSFFGENDPVFFDIETTGLSWRTSHTCMIGYLCRRGSEWVFSQWLLDHPFAEKEMLTAFADLLTSGQIKKPILVHYNGNTFDVPYLTNKFLFYKIPDPFPSLQSLDLFREFRKLKKPLGLSSMKQQDVEKFLHTGRTDHMSGREFAALYQNWLLSPSDETAEMLYRHNRDDVMGLLQLLPLLHLADLYSGQFEILHTRKENDSLIITLQLQHKLPCPLSLSDSYYQLETVKPDEPADGYDTLTLEIRGEYGIRKYFFSDYKNYYYLPGEDQAIHKSIAVYTDPAHRKKATAATCYEKKEGLFFPQPSEILQPCLYREYRDKTSWFLPDALSAADDQTLYAYADDVIRYLMNK